jgi:tRNA dimethylallyltransferase
MPLQMKKLIVIVGSNASGKSELAVRLAKKFNGEVISADSRQVYKGLDIGSGKITKKEMAGIPHHLIDVISPKRTFTVAQYQKLALKAIKNIWRRDKLPIICGGTGFYIQAVVDGFLIPEVKPNFLLRQKLQKLETNILFKLLKQKDLRRAKTIDRHNRLRLIRALEIADAIGKVPKLKKNPLQADILMLGMKKSSPELKQRIRKRLMRQLKTGMAQEVKRLRRNGVSWKRLENLGLEYRYIAFYFQNKIKKEELFPALAKEIFRYAKRQMTWFKRDKRIKWLENKNQAENQTEKLVLNFLSE